MRAIEYEQINSRITTPWMAFAIAQLFLVFHFIPLPKMFGMPFAPVNLIFLISGLFLFVKMHYLTNLNRRVLFVFMLLTLFVFMEVAFNVLRAENSGFIFGKLKIIYLMFFLTVFFVEEKKLISLIKTFIVLTVISIIFGTLVYLFGEPFSNIREWLASSKSTTETTIIGKGSMLTGIYCIPHIFGYLLAMTPILCLSLYFAGKNIFWILCFIVCLVGLLLNAERSALLMNIFVISIFIIKQKKSISMFFVIILTLLGFVFAQKYLFIDVNKLNNSDGHLTTGNLSERLKETEIDDVVKRLQWQFYGFMVVLKYPVLGVTSEQYNTEMKIRRLGHSSIMSTTKEVAPHNHYVNVGLKAGILGWVVMCLIFLIIFQIVLSDFSNQLSDDVLKETVFGLKLSVLAGLGNGIFHNAGLFSAELATCVSIGLLLTSYNIAQYQKSMSSQKKI